MFRSDVELEQTLLECDCWLPFFIVIFSVFDAEFYDVWSSLLYWVFTGWILIFYSCCLFNDLWHRISILDLSAGTFIYYISLFWVSLFITFPRCYSRCLRCWVSWCSSPRLAAGRSSDSSDLLALRYCVCSGGYQGCWWLKCHASQLYMSWLLVHLLAHRPVKITKSQIE